MSRWLIVRLLVLVALATSYAAVLLYAPIIRAQVERPVDLDRHQRDLALLLGRITYNEAADSEADGELIAQIVFGRGETAAAQYTWLRWHSRCVSGVLSQDEAYARPGNCRWARNLRPDGRRPRGWFGDRDGHWSRAQARWRAVLGRAVEYVRGDRSAAICDEQPQTWDGTRYGREAVLARGSRRRILECRAPYVIGAHREGLHNFAVTLASAGDDA